MERWLTSKQKMPSSAQPSATYERGQQQKWSRLQRALRTTDSGGRILKSVHKLAAVSKPEPSDWVAIVLHLTKLESDTLHGFGIAAIVD